MLHLTLIILSKQMQSCHWWCHWHHMMLRPVASHDQNYCISFWSFQPNKWNGSSDDTVGIMWCIHQDQWHYMTPQKLCCTSFWLSWLNKCRGTTDDSTGITWCWCQWHHMTKWFVGSPLIILNYQLEWCHCWHCWHNLTLTSASVALHYPKNYVTLFSIVLT